MIPVLLTYPFDPVVSTGVGASVRVPVLHTIIYLRSTWVQAAFFVMAGVVPGNVTWQVFGITVFAIFRSSGVVIGPTAKNIGIAIKPRLYSCRLSLQQSGSVVIRAPFMWVLFST